MMFERLGAPGEESSNGFNNAGAREGRLCSAGTFYQDGLLGPIIPIINPISGLFEGVIGYNSPSW